MFKRLFASRKHPYVPGLDQREEIEMDISGNRLTMLLPPHSDSDGFRRKPPPRRVNIHDPDQFHGDEELPEWQRSGNAYYHGPRPDRHWEFYGPPWRQRPYGFIAFSMPISRQDAMPEGMSCFNPAHLEQVINRSLYFSGPAEPTMPRKKGPINWHLRSESGATGIYFETHRDVAYYGSEAAPFEFASRTCVLILPLEHRYCLSVSFRYLGYAPAQHCLSNMNALRDSVLDSVRLELGPSAREQLAEAQRKWPQAHASESREPIDWDYPEWRKGNYRKGEPRIIILKPGSPPPEFTPC